MPNNCNFKEVKPKNAKGSHDCIVPTLYSACNFTGSSVELPDNKPNANITFTPHSICLPPGKQVRVWENYGQNNKVGGKSHLIGGGKAIVSTLNCDANGVFKALLAVNKNLKGAKKTVRSFRVTAEPLL